MQQPISDAHPNTYLNSANFDGLSCRFPKMGISNSWMVISWKIHRWMIWGYPHFRKPPYGDLKWWLEILFKIENNPYEWLLTIPSENYTVHNLCVPSIQACDAAASSFFRACTSDLGCAWDPRNIGRYWEYHRDRDIYKYYITLQYCISSYNRPKLNFTS